jgi:hypothetical protein
MGGNRTFPVYLDRDARPGLKLRHSLPEAMLLDASTISALPLVG